MIAATAVVMALIAEALALYALAEWLAGGWDGPAVSAWALVVVALGGYYLPRALDELDVANRLRTLLSAGGTFIIVYGAMREAGARDIRIWDLIWAWRFLESPGDTLAGQGGPLITVVLVLVAWVRSSYRSREDIDLESMTRTLALPLVLVTVLVVVATPSPHAAEVGRAGLVFFATAVLALACSQLALSGATFGDLRAGGVTAALLAGVVGATVAAVAVIAVLFGLLGPTLGPPLGRAAEAVLLVVLTPPAWLIQHVMEFLLAGRSPLPNLTQQVQQTAQQAGDSGTDDPSSFQVAVVYFWRAVALGFMLLLVAGAATTFLWMRRSRSRAAEAAPERERAGGPGEGLRAFVQGLFGRRDRVTEAAPASAARRLYLDVLARAERDGHQRPPGSTPGEFAPELHDTFHTAVTDDITRAFEEARYAGREPDAAEVAELERRWRAVR